MFKGDWSMKWQKASYTVESAILIPIFFSILLLALHMAISFYEECTTTIQYDKLEIDVMEEFYACQKWNIERTTDD